MTDDRMTPPEAAPMREPKHKPLSYAQTQYLEKLKYRGDSRITNATGTALEKRGLVIWRHDPLAPWGGEWALADGSTPSSNRGVK